MTENLTMVFETYQEAADEALFLVSTRRRHDRPLPGVEPYAVLSSTVIYGFLVTPFHGLDMSDPDNADRLIHVYYPEGDA